MPWSGLARSDRGRRSRGRESVPGRGAEQKSVGASSAARAAVQLQSGMQVSRRHLAIAAAGALVLAVAVWISTRTPELTPEQQIEALIEGAVDDAEDGDIGDLLDRVSPTYEGEGGDRQALRAYLTGALLGGGVTVQVVSQRITVGDQNATVQLEVILARGGLGGALRGDVGVRTLQLDLGHEDGEWKVRGAVLD
jgi:hypothetical protein